MTDREQIEEVLHAYATHIDKGEAQGLVRDVFAADAVVDLGYGVWEGAEEAARQIGGEIELFEGSAHMLSNLTVSLEGDSARSTIYVTAWHWNRGEGNADPERPADFVTAGVYIDRLRRDPEGWRVIHRRFRRLGPSAIAIGKLPEFIQPEG
ncbi:MAG: nuclear transport factor 2 family protein [Solirubrobacterales bacterium]